jgi:uncharacterized protein YecE (DUF72 family)
MLRIRKMSQKETRIGCSGWSYKEWKGTFYPDKLSSAKYLDYYSQLFNTVEVNNTFYRFPPSTIVKRWYQYAPKEFKYSLKVNKQITHIKRLKQVDEELKLFYGLSDVLREKTGYFLFQFPRSFIFSEEHLENLLLAIHPAHKNVVEFRHESWWNEQVIKALTTVNATFCTVSGFAVPDNLFVLQKRAYIRFHGSPSYDENYACNELSFWKQKIQDTDINSLWIYFNNTAHGYAPSNALHLAKMLAQ